MEEKELARLKVLKKNQMPDGLYRTEDGQKIFHDELTPVGGVNMYSQGEPPSKQLGGDTDTKNMGEDEEEQKELGQAWKDSEEFQKKENARKADEAAQRA